ncbi:EAL domain-containing protein [Rhizobium sp. TRM95111]|uniref:bifunctional diguanylate cyclase/phosphodiesterase n=1 Tax=Rhizobium alarense TaxID=2846851 RepID=UPI001F3E799A|nr:EAL domain-containing protein [Rhizobium alarense]MCF3642653.1 EAL domain-containing protein [Rhizobium alarense]
MRDLVARLRARHHYLPAVAATIAVSLAGVLADIQRGNLDEEYLRSHTTRQLGLLRSRLEGNIRGDVKRVQGLIATLSTEPGMSQKRFEQLASRTFDDDTQLRNLALAPGLVVSMVYPLAGNEKTIGLDYRKNVAQRAAALRVRDTGKLVLTGPVNLVQGGRGLIARYPVFNDAADGGKRFWGIASAVIDLEKLIENSGLADPALSISVALASADENGRSIDTFFGDTRIFLEEPVRMVVDLGDERWIIAGMPKDGWQQDAGIRWRFRALLLLLGLAIVTPIFWVGRLMRERQRHIAALQQREDQLQTLSQRLELALDISKIGVWEYHTDSGALIWDDRMRRLYGIPASRTVCTYADWRGALHPDDLAEAERIFAESVEAEQPYITEFRVIDADGGIRHIRAHGMTYRCASGAKRVIGANWNVTDDVRLQDELREAKSRAERQNIALEDARRTMEHNALHDALTGLPNRRYLDERLAVLNGGEAPLTLLHLDLDRFKEINDTLGHAAGDTILRRTAVALRAVVGDDFVARIGGDEFVVLSVADRPVAHFVELAGRIVAEVSRPMLIEGHECRVGASVGVAARADGREAAEQLLIDADLALYEAKRHGRNRVEFFNETLRHTSIQTKKLSDEMLRGLERGEFDAFFHPQFDAATREIVGVEALARWHHPERGLLAPDAFLAVAESLNVVPAIDDAVLRQALLQFTRWQAHGLAIPRVSVNVSGQRLRDERLIDTLRGLAIRPGTVSFELLESISFDSADDRLRQSIEEIKRLGIDVEIDDFGTGHASIVSLLELSPRRLKIDRRLVMPILDSLSQQRLVRSIVDIGRARGIEIVAEGVETPEHADMLRDIGCHILQGYAFARPMPADAFLAFATARSWLSARSRASA